MAESLSAKMRDMVSDWLVNDEYTTRALADRLARLAEQHFAGSVPAQANPSAEHYERVMLTCAALEGAMANVNEIEQARLAAEFAEEAADYALERIGWREAESREAESERLTAKLSYEPHVCRAEGCDDPPRYCGAHAGVDTTVSDATDAATVTDEVYRLQSVLQQARKMAREMSWKLHNHGSGSGVFEEAIRSLRATIDDLCRHFGVQGKGVDDA